MHDEKAAAIESCGNHGSEKIFDVLKAKLNGVNQNIEVEQIKCFGYCEYGPNVRIPSKGKMWSEVKENALEDIIEYCISNK
ncbi:(2Fe-2S) ferredoxin domain-containing protein [Methylophilus sp. Leaf408]|uniref:(2Fe-2S) ferredoxin domain-containing protein n=1 Tax=Methylophilus sp. Leaf408 TaxID=2876561 RepID=UPI001E2ED09E|nr:(2Fe-2S) ferredoxin domain-containing protein [Methylophilus sp. Leaf408]